MSLHNALESILPPPHRPPPTTQVMSHWRNVTPDLPPALYSDIESLAQSIWFTYGDVKVTEFDKWRAISLSYIPLSPDDDTWPAPGALVLNLLKWNGVDGESRRAKYQIDFMRCRIKIKHGDRGVEYIQKGEMDDGWVRVIKDAREWATGIFERDEEERAKRQLLDDGAMERWREHLRKQQEAEDEAARQYEERLGLKQSNSRKRKSPLGHCWTCKEKASISFFPARHLSLRLLPFTGNSY